MRKKLIHLAGMFACFAFVLSLAGNLKSQGLTGTIIGRVYDPSGAVIPGVHVVATNMDTGITRDATSDGSGFYALPALLAGNYSVEASVKGFKTVKQGPVSLSSTQQISLDFTLSPGAVQQTVEVKAVAQQLQTQESSVKAKVFLDEVQNLPLNTRSPFELALLSPSIFVSNQQTGPAMQFNINGQNSNGYKLMFDGIEAGIGTDAQYFAGNNFNLAMTSLDAIQEYDIATSNYSADIKGSGGYVNIVSKTGTNKLHFSLYDFFRNGDLDARYFFQATRSDLKLNDYGGTIGGPIKKDKVFFMLSYEAQRIHLPFPAFADVPTAAFDMTVSPNLQPFLALTPLPTVAIPGNANIGIYEASPLSTARQDVGTSRVDFNVSAKDRIFVTYTVNDANLNGATLDPRVSQANTQTIFPGYIYIQPETHQDSTLGWTRSFSPSFVNDLKIGINRYLQGRVRGPVPSPYFDVPAITVSGVVIGGGGNAKKFGNTQPQAVDKATWVKGKSTLSFGGNYGFLMTGQSGLSVESMSFPSLAAFAADAPSSVSSTYGLSLASKSEHLSYSQVGLFVQEDYRWTPKVTVNLGLRYDDFGVFSNSTGIARNVIQGPFDAYRASGQALYNANHDFAPRVGIAWRPSTSKPLVLRGGFGQFYGTHVSGQEGDVLDSNTSLPFAVTSVELPGLTYPFSQAFYNLVTYSPGRSVLNPTTKDLYTLQWNATAEYQLGAATLITIAYVGNHDVHVPGEQQPNAYSPLLGGRPDPNLGAVKYIANEDSTHYHALQVSVRRRLTNNFSFDVNYAWSHTTGFQTGSLEISAAVGFSADQYQTPTNRELSRGNLFYNTPNNLSTDLVYKLPTLAGSSPFVKNVLGNWTTSGDLKASTGPPFTVLTGGDTGDGLVLQRPNRVPGVPLTLKGVSPANGFINRAAFTTPTAVDPANGLILGNLADNSATMPPSLFLDWMLGKRVYSSDKLNLDFRTEFFNVLNHPVFAPPPVTLTSSTFGVSSSTGFPRQIQFMLRLSF